jgi:hypothetical protein
MSIAPAAAKPKGHTGPSALSNFCVSYKIIYARTKGIIPEQVIIFIRLRCSFITILNVSGNALITGSTAIAGMVIA